MYRQAAVSDDKEVVVLHVVGELIGLFALGVVVVDQQHLIAQERPPPASASTAALRLPALIGWSELIDMVDTSVLFGLVWLVRIGTRLIERTEMLGISSS